MREVYSIHNNEYITSNKNILNNQSANNVFQDPVEYLYQQVWLYFLYISVDPCILSLSQQTFHECIHFSPGRLKGFVTRCSLTESGVAPQKEKKNVDRRLHQPITMQNEESWAGSQWSWLCSIVETKTVDISQSKAPGCHCL